MSFLTKASIVASAIALASAMPVQKRGSGKGGVAYNDASYTGDFTGSRISWAYDWVSNPNGQIQNGLEYIPLLHNDQDTFTNPWKSEAETAIANGATAILGFNEPDISSQADMTVDAAVTAWNKYIQPFATSHPDVKLIAPAVSNGQAPLGQAWLDEFLQKCTGCKIDGVALHWYADAAYGSGFTSYFDEAIAKYNKPVWVTEFAVTNTDDNGASDFMKNTALPYLDHTDGIERYAYQWAAPGSLINSDGNGLSGSGQTYNSFSD